MLFALSFVLALAFALTRLAFVLAFVLFPFALAGRAFRFHRPCQTIHSVDCFASIQFSFDTLTPCDRTFHTMNRFFGTFDLDCPSLKNPSEQAVCFFVPIQLFDLIHKLRPFCRASGVVEQMIPKNTFLQTFDDNSDFDQI